ncbi:hypothetical protein PQR14_20215 [Paraburkholderia bryophila]|uniref:hypothetical protein n=1 Tax=Burkholderiaceae TaxID=119060 RepID=UPI0005573257|nr:MULTISPECIES: hypothetical protein [Burkholderiaceae]
MQLGSGTLTPQADKSPVTVQCKVYWVHKQLWNASWITQYHAAVPALAKEIAARKVDMANLSTEPIDGSPTGGKDANRFTCEDFAFEVLIEFASRNKLPLKIQTQSVVFKNIDKDYQSGDKSGPPTPSGFAIDVAIASGASDIARNCVAVADKDLLPGDLFLEFNKGHVQVVTSASVSRVEIMQGNFPGLESNPRKIMSKLLLGKWLRATNAGNRESSLYLGVPVGAATYERRNGQWLYQRLYGTYHGWDSDVWGTMSLHLRWKFLEFNNI